MCWLVVMVVRGVHAATLQGSDDSAGSGEGASLCWDSGMGGKADVTETGLWAVAG